MQPTLTTRTVRYKLPNIHTISLASISMVVGMVSLGAVYCIKEWAFRTVIQHRWHSEGFEVSWYLRLLIFLRRLVPETNAIAESERVIEFIQVQISLVVCVSWSSHEQNVVPESQEHHIMQLEFSHDVVRLLYIVAHLKSDDMLILLAIQDQERYLACSESMVGCLRHTTRVTLIPAWRLG